MRKYAIFLFFAFYPLLLLSQEKKSTSEDVPFAIIEEVPIFPGCEKLDKNLQRMCLQNRIKQHVAKKFKIKKALKLGLQPGKKRVYVQFKIDKNGNVTNVRARGPHKKIEKEAIRVVESLPKMIPGKNNGKNIGVKYTLPITFLVK